MATVIRINVNASLSWRAKRDAATRTWVGVCDALRLTATGETWQELTEVINEITSHLMRTLLEEGELPGFLSQHGWHLETPLPTGLPANEPLMFDVPARIEPQYASA